jgi:alginate O-acetyltransferase complex protein AlgI
MLFNSYAFILAFLPAALLVFLVAQRWRLHVWAMLFASLVFYAFWDLHFLALLIGSILVNFIIGRQLRRLVAADRRRAANALLSAGLAWNLGVLGWFKYAIFFSQNLYALGLVDSVLGGIILPLGISFYTFEQIGFLVDIRRGADYRPRLRDYALFVMFFPRVVAGPILRFNEIIPQTTQPKRPGQVAQDIAIGLTLFAIGLCKKAFLADGVAPYANAGFNEAAAGGTPDLFAAWGATLAYTCQLYFDFSGYSDMAIGIARCFGIRFPENFNSPYKAGSIIEFWRRWHITLSRFLRDYLYISLGGNRRGPARRYANLLLTMLLGGLWHGAAWTFVVWGALHGLALAANHGWNTLRIAAVLRGRPWWRAFAFLLTFLLVVVAWVFFRAPDLATAGRVLAGMAGQHGAQLPEAILQGAGPLGAIATGLGIRTGGSGAHFVETWSWVVPLLLIAWFAPNAQQLLRPLEPTLDSRPDPHRGPVWRLTLPWAIAAAAFATLGFLSLTRGGEFLYWQF